MWVSARPEGDRGDGEEQDYARHEHDKTVRAVVAAVIQGEDGECLAANPASRMTMALAATARDCPLCPPEGRLPGDIIMGQETGRFDWPTLGGFSADSVGSSLDADGLFRSHMAYSSALRRPRVAWPTGSIDPHAPRGRPRRRLSRSSA